MKKVLLLIPTHNAQVFLPQTLESIANLEERHDIQIETVVVDNNSIDETVKIAERFEVDVVKNELNIGRVENWNNCLEIFKNSDADYCKLIFAGDTITPDSISQQIDANEDMVTGMHTVLNEDGTSYMMQHYSYDITFHPQSSLNESLKRGNWFAGTTACVLFSKKALGNTRFNKELLWAADWKFWADLAAKVPVKYLARPVATFSMFSRQGYKRLAGTERASKEETTVKLLIENLLLPSISNG